MQLKELLLRSDALPSAPEAVVELSRTFEDDDARTTDVVEALQADPMLVVQLLRVANSPAFYRGRLIEDAVEAVRLIGLSKVRALVIGLLARDAFPDVPEDALERFWRVSLNTAELARAIAAERSSDEDTAFLGGLLHLVGELAMRVAMPERMGALDARIAPMSPERAKEEVKNFAYSWAEVGAELARRWRLPYAVVRIIEKQRDMTLKPAQDANVMIVQLAAWRARAIEMQMSPEEQVETFPAALARGLGITPEFVLSWKPPSEADTVIEPQDE